MEWTVADVHVRRGTRKRIATRRGRRTSCTRGRRKTDARARSRRESSPGIGRKIVVEAREETSGSSRRWCC